MDNLFLVNKDDLIETLQTCVLGRFEDREVSSSAACEILSISLSTLNRLVEAKVISPIKKGETRAIRKFNLAYLLSLDKKTIQKEYRQRQ